MFYYLPLVPHFSQLSVGSPIPDFISYMTFWITLYILTFDWRLYFATTLQPPSMLHPRLACGTPGVENNECEKRVPRNKATPKQSMVSGQRFIQSKE